MDRYKQQKQLTNVYVAVDFGTTYSGITFQKVKNGVGIGDKRQVRQWPCREGINVDEAKVPSKLQYRLNAQGGYVVSAWGYQVQGDDELTVEWFKLLLLKDEELPDHLRFSPQLIEMRLRLQKIKKTATDVVSDYLTELWEHAINEDQMPPEGEIYKSVGIAISLVPIRVIFTVPAIWSDSAMEAMKLAANKSLINVSRPAGVTSFEFLSEPEAAAHAYAKEIIETSNVGDTVLVCDLGGGTGDCISYQVTDRDSFELKEVVPGTGAICGGSILDEAFKDLCKEVLHSHLQPTTAERWHAILRDHWEHNLKRSFKFTGNARPFPVYLPTQNNNNNCVYFHEDQLCDVFNSSVVPTIVGLIRNQINSIETKTGKSPAMILLVGGFGRCPFIRQVLEKEFRTKKGKSKGAVEHALKPRVGTRIAQRSIGFQQKIPASIEEGGEYDEVLGDYRLPDGMSWVVRKGEEVSSSSKTLAETWVYSDLDRQHFGERLPEHVAKFYAYDGENPPSRYGDGVGFQERGSMTLKVPVMIKDLPKVKDEDEEAIANPWVFEYDLQINCSGVSTEITAVTTGSLVSNHIKEGTKVGEVTMDLEKMGMIDRNEK